MRKTNGKKDSNNKPLTSARPLDALERAIRSAKWVSLAAIVFSIAFHSISYVQLGNYKANTKNNHKPWSKQSVKIKIKPKPKPKPEKPKPPPIAEEPDQRIVETPMEKTEKPTEKSRLGVNDHIAEKETKIKPKPNPDKALEAGKKGNKGNLQKPADIPGPPKIVKKEKIPAQVKKPQEKIAEEKPEKKVEKKDKKKIMTAITKSDTSMPMKPNMPEEKPREKKKGGSPLVHKPRNAYERLLALSSGSLDGQINAGYEEYIDEDVDVANAIDLNTTQYRFIGYFSSLRKAIELVWVYPHEAIRRGMQGTVGLVWTINEDGHAEKIKVFRSSGYQILDDATVEAIRLASPFSPLPKDIDRKKLSLRYNFRYQLYPSH